MIFNKFKMTVFFRFFFFCSRFVLAHERKIYNRFHIAIRCVAKILQNFQELLVSFVKCEWDKLLENGNDMLGLFFLSHSIPLTSLFFHPFVRLFVFHFYKSVMLQWQFKHERASIKCACFRTFVTTWVITRIKLLEFSLAFTRCLSLSLSRAPTWIRLHICCWCIGCYTIIASFTIDGIGCTKCTSLTKS